MTLLKVIKFAYSSHQFDLNHKIKILADQLKRQQTDLVFLAKIAKDRNMFGKVAANKRISLDLVGQI